MVRNHSHAVSRRYKGGPRVISTELLFRTFAEANCLRQGGFEAFSDPRSSIGVISEQVAELS